MRRTPAYELHATSLPLWIAAACLVAGVWLFFGNTLPALRESEQLSGVERDFDGLKRRLDLAAERARLSGAGNGTDDIDLQSLFVAIDEMGLTITEFCEAYPVEGADPGAADR